jgi:hypothetical protein
LIGNHDHHYLDVDERYSGFQVGYQWDIRKLLYSHRELMDVCKVIGEYMFSHAGVTKT